MKKYDDAGGVEIHNDDEFEITIMHADNVYINCESDHESGSKRSFPVKVKPKETSSMVALPSKGRTITTESQRSQRAVSSEQQLSKRSSSRTPIRSSRPVPSRTPPTVSGRRAPTRTPPTLSARRVPSRTPPTMSSRRVPSRTPPSMSSRRGSTRTPTKGQLKTARTTSEKSVQTLTARSPGASTASTRGRKPFIVEETINRTDGAPEALPSRSVPICEHICPFALVPCVIGSRSMSVPRHLRQPKDPYRPPKRAVSVASSARTPVYQRGRPQHTTSHLPSAETITKPKRKELPSKPRSTSKPKTPVYQSTRPRHTTSHLPSAESTARREELPSETRSTSIKSRSAKTPVKSPRSRRTPEIRSQLAPWGTSAEVCFQDAPPLNPAFLESTSSQVEKSVEKPSKSPRRSPRRKKRKRKDRHGDLKKTGSYLDLTSKYAVAGRKQKQKSSSTAPSSQDKLSSGTPSGVSGELSLEISTKDMPTSATEASQKSTASEPKFIFKVHKPRKGERKPSKKKYKESGKRETDHKLVEKSESDLSQTDQPEEDERKQTRLPQKLDYIRQSRESIKESRQIMKKQDVKKKQERHAAKEFVNPTRMKRPQGEQEEEVLRFPPPPIPTSTTSSTTRPARPMPEESSFFSASDSRSLGRSYHRKAKRKRGSHRKSAVLQPSFQPAEPKMSYLDQQIARRRVKKTPEKPAKVTTPSTPQVSTARADSKLSTAKAGSGLLVTAQEKPQSFDSGSVSLSDSSGKSKKGDSSSGGDSDRTPKFDSKLYTPRGSKLDSKPAQKKKPTIQRIDVGVPTYTLPTLKQSQSIDSQSSGGMKFDAKFQIKDVDNNLEHVLSVNCHFMDKQLKKIVLNGKHGRI
ncbi:hypothetical protein V3C99_005492 [Haemonchus contortus]